jgi:hypothetical protein
MATETMRGAELVRLQARQARQDRLRRALRSLPAYILLGAFSLSALLTILWALIISVVHKYELLS